MIKEELLKKPREIEQEKTDSVKEHINMFAKVESHYTRENSKREYLDEKLSISEMYRLYIIWARKNGKMIATKHHYNDIFNTQFNLSFFKPKKDQCNLCEGYENALQ